MSDADEVILAYSKHVGKLWRCFLCHEPIPHPAGMFKYDDSREWPFDSGLVSVLSYTAEDGSVRQHLRSIGIRDLEFSYLDVPIPNHNEDLFDRWCAKQTLCGDYCRDCRPDCMAYLSHRDCWKVAFSSHRWSPLDWSRLAVQTRPFEIRNWNTKHQFAMCHGDIIIPSLASVPPIEGRLWTRLARILARIRRLPTEIQLQIMGYLKGTMFGSLLQAKRFILEVMPHLGPCSTWTTQPQTKCLRVDGEASPKSLSCRSISIMGRLYLKELGFGQSDDSRSSITIAKKALRGLQFALGRFGLRGIRIWYDDRSFSPWLGETSSCWIGTLRCCDLSNVNIVIDELRVIRVEIEQTIQSQSETSIMWWGEGPPGAIHMVEEIPGPELHYYRGWKQCQYLPLSFGEQYASGLTVYLSSNFCHVIGFVSHGTSDFVFGEAVEVRHNRGIPFHLAFSPGEYLSSAWLHLEPHSVGRDCGMIVLATNLGRVHPIGFHPFRRQRKLANSAWIRLSTVGASKIRGLVVNIPEFVRAADKHNIPYFGVSQDALLPEESNEEIQPPSLSVHARGPTLPSQYFTYYLRERKGRYGFSTASLNNIASIYARQKTARDKTKKSKLSWCVGLRIVHNDSSVEILGRWDPRDKHSISRIYDTSEGSLTSVSFHMADFSKLTIVRCVTVAVTNTPWTCQPLDASLVVPMSPPDHRWNCRSAGNPPFFPGTRRFDCTQSSQRVAWWFTNGYDDISRDHGSPTVQAEGHSSFCGPLRTIQVGCDGMVI